MCLKCIFGVKSAKKKLGGGNKNCWVGNRKQKNYSIRP